MMKLRYTPKMLIEDLALVFNVFVSLFAIIFATPFVILLYTYIIVTRPFKEWMRRNRWKNKMKGYDSTSI